MSGESMDVWSISACSRIGRRGSSTLPTATRCSKGTECAQRGDGGGTAGLHQRLTARTGFASCGGARSRDLSGRVCIVDVAQSGRAPLVVTLEDVGRSNRPIDRHAGWSACVGRKSTRTVRADRVTDLQSAEPVSTRATGFDLARDAEVIVSAVSVRREQLAKSKSKRQRVVLSGCGLRDVRAQGVRVTHGRKHTSSAETLLRVSAQIQKVVEARHPRLRQRPSVALNRTTHVSELFRSKVEDRGSIPRACTKESEVSNEVINPRRIDGAHCGRVSDACSVAGGGAETSALMLSARNERPVWRSLVARRGSANYAEVARSNRATGPRSAEDAKTATSVTREGAGQSREVARRLGTIGGICSWRTPTGNPAPLACTVDLLTAGETAPGNGQELRGALGHALVAKLALNPTEGERPSCSATGRMFGSSVEDNRDPCCESIHRGVATPGKLSLERGARAWESATSQRHSAHRKGHCCARQASDLTVYPKQLGKRVVSSAQQQGSAGRPASVALGVTGSAAAQPALMGSGS